MISTMSFKPDERGNSEKTVKKMENCAMEVRDWLVENKLMNNDGKTLISIIGTPQQLKKVQIGTIRNGESDIPISQQVKNPGVIFDSELSMHQHVGMLCKNGFYHLRNIVQVHKNLTRDTAETMVHAFVTSTLDCCNALLYGLPNRQISRLQHLQNASARVITHTNKYDHITPALEDLHWLPISSSIEFKCLVIVWKALHGLAPKYLSDLIYVRQSRSRRTQGRIILEDHLTKLVTGGDRSFRKMAPTLWNALAGHIAVAETLTSFKSALKTHLFRKCF